MHPYISGCMAGWLAGWLQCWLAGYWLKNHLFTMSLTYTTTNILCTATDVGMHGLWVNRVTILCYPLVWVHCWPVADFFIAKQTSLHPFDFVRNLFHYLFVFFFHKKLNLWLSWPTHAQRAPPHLQRNRFRNSRLVILHASELATELFDELQSLICTFAMSI